MANLTALRLQALSGDNGQDSTAPSVTDPGDQEDPASVLDALGEIAGDRVAATAKAEVRSSYNANIAPTMSDKLPAY